MRVKGEVAAGGGGHAWQFGEYPQVKEKLLAMRATEAGAECIPLLGLLFEVGGWVGRVGRVGRGVGGCQASVGL